jgi:hypothetical protein
MNKMLIASIVAATVANAANNTPQIDVAVIDPSADSAALQGDHTLIAAHDAQNPDAPIDGQSIEQDQSEKTFGQKAKDAANASLAHLQANKAAYLIGSTVALVGMPLVLSAHKATGALTAKTTYDAAKTDRNFFQKAVAGYESISLAYLPGFLNDTIGITASGKFNKKFNQLNKAQTAAELAAKNAQAALDAAKLKIVAETKAYTDEAKDQDDTIKSIQDDTTITDAKVKAEKLKEATEEKAKALKDIFEAEVKTVAVTTNADVVKLTTEATEKATALSKAKKDLDDHKATQAAVPATA